MNNEIKFQKHEVLKSLLKILLGLVILLVSSYVITACNTANVVLDASNIIDKQCCTKDLTEIIYFRTEDFGTYYMYTYDENDNSVITNEDRYAFNYTIESNSITLDFIEESLADINLYYIKDAVINIDNNAYYYIL